MTNISLWNGKALDKYTKDELIEIVEHLGEQLNKFRTQELFNRRWYESYSKQRMEDFYRDRGED